MEYKGYIIVPSSRPGKAVKGTKKRNSIQVRKPLGVDGYLLQKQIGYPVNDFIKEQEAIEKAKNLLIKKHQKNFN